MITKIRQASNTNNTGYKFQISVQFIFGLGDLLSLMACRIKNHSGKFNKKKHVSLSCVLYFLFLDITVIAYMLQYRFSLKLLINCFLRHC